MGCRCTKVLGAVVSSAKAFNVPRRLPLIKSATVSESLHPGTRFRSDRSFPAKGRVRPGPVTKQNLVHLLLVKWKFTPDHIARPRQHAVKATRCGETERYRLDVPLHRSRCKYGQQSPCHCRPQRRKGRNHSGIEGTHVERFMPNRSICTTDSEKHECGSDLVKVAVFAKIYEELCCTRVWARCGKRKIAAPVHKRNGPPREQQVTGCFATQHKAKHTHVLLCTGGSSGILEFPYFRLICQQTRPAS